MSIEINEYLQQRWSNLSLETKRLLNLNDPVAMMFLETLWRLQYARSLTDERRD